MEMETTPMPVLMEQVERVNPLNVAINSSKQVKKIVMMAMMTILMRVFHVQMHNVVMVILVLILHPITLDMSSVMMEIKIMMMHVLQLV
jgi:ABC-type thiamin/hydroxymethylpyrimidine transport system permease subunit